MPSGLLQPVVIAEWKWDRVMMDFVSGLPLSLKKKDVIWVVIDRLTKSAHFISVSTNFSLDRLAELYISKIVRLQGVPDSSISDRIRGLRGDFGRNCKKLWSLKATGKNSYRWLNSRITIVFNRRDRRESESNSRQFENSFRSIEIRQSVFKSITVEEDSSIWLQRKIESSFIGPYEIIEKIGPVAYRLALPSELEKIHNIRSVTLREVKELRNKNIALVKVLWQLHNVEEATWEPEEAMRKQYPNLFFGKIFGDENSLGGEL
ncbi:IPP transferase [Gossypium australe]|uniref:IPP transferase n=1 Tax=Gossypium australe TaxID=47621 RepID=A0A5B6X5J4_9ROSI|nr:IPP transferase [Gossypium australe]